MRTNHTLCLALLLLGGCVRETQATEVMLEIDAEPEVHARLARLSVDVRGGSAHAAIADFTRNEAPPIAHPELPLKVGLVPLGGDATRIYDVVVTAYDADGQFVAATRLISGYVPERIRYARLVLEDACIGVDGCEGEDSAPLSCRHGACVDPRVDPLALSAHQAGADLPELDLEPAPDAAAEDVDGGEVHDAGVEDSAAPQGDSSDGAPTYECVGNVWDHDNSPMTACAPRRSCVPGEYVASNGDATTDRACAGCPSGSFSTSENAASCTRWNDCQPGSVTAKAPSSSVDRTCMPCADGTFASGTNQSICLPEGSCPAGSERALAASTAAPASCRACSPGSFCPGGDAPAVPCAEDSWDHDSSATTACVPRTRCVAGQRASAAGDSLHDRVCTGCIAGTFSTDSNANGCATWHSCAAGSYVTNTPSTTEDRVCAVCASGSFSASANQATCLPQGSCNAGSKQVVAASGTSGAQCEACRSGEYCAGGTAAPIACGSGGTWDHDLNPSTACAPRTECVAGQFVIAEGSGTSDRSCGTCAQGSFSTQSNTPSCATWTSCPAGWQQSAPGSSTKDRTCAPCNGACQACTKIATGQTGFEQATVAGGKLFFQAASTTLRWIPVAGGSATDVNTVGTSGYNTAGVMTTDGTTVFYSIAFEPGIGSIWSVRADGTANTKISQAEAYNFGLAFDASHVYWTRSYIGQYALRRANRDGSNVITLDPAGSEPRGLVLLGGILYWSAQGSGAIYSIDTAGVGPRKTVLGGLSSPEQLVSDGTHLIFATRGDGLIRKLHPGTGAITPLYTGSGPYIALFLAAPSVYATQSDKVLRIALDGSGASTVLALPGAYGVAADETHVYAGSLTSGDVWRCAR